MRCAFNSYRLTHSLTTKFILHSYCVFTLIPSSERLSHALKYIDFQTNKTKAADFNAIERFYLIVSKIESTLISSVRHKSIRVLLTYNQRMISTVVNIFQTEICTHRRCRGRRHFNSILMSLIIEYCTAKLLQKMNTANLQLV